MVLVCGDTLVVWLKLNFQNTRQKKGQGCHRRHPRLFYKCTLLIISRASVITSGLPNMDTIMTRYNSYIKR